MRLLLFLGRIAFIFNLFFIACLIFRYNDIVTAQSIKGFVIVIGWLIAPVVNFVFVSSFIIARLFKKTFISFNSAVDVYLQLHFVSSSNCNNAFCMIHNIIKDKSTKLFIVLGCFFAANALIAEFMGVKIFSLEKTFNLSPVNLALFGNNYSFNLTAGVLLWPVVFIMTDIINEYFGQRGVKFLSYITVALISYAFVMVFIAIKTSPADFLVGNGVKNGIPDMNAAYANIFGQGLWIIIGSLVAFLIGQVVDVLVFHKIKRITGERFIWLRATGSTLISQLIDSFIVLFIAFYLGPRISDIQGEPWPLNLVLAVGLGNYIYKFIMAVVLTPVIYLVHNIIEKYLGNNTAREMKLAAMNNR